MLRRIPEIFEKYPNRTAMVIQEKAYSYNELHKRVCYIMSLINNKNLCQSYIGLYANNDIDTYAAVLAIMFSGNAYVPICPKNPKERNAIIDKLISPEYILSSTSETANFTTKEKLIDISFFDFHVHSIKVEFQDDWPAYMMFTSGSTGTPKSVPVSHKNLRLFLDAYMKTGYQISENDRFLQMFELSFDLSIITFLLPMTIGASVYTVPEKQIHYMGVYEVLENHNITFAVLIPSVIQQLKPYFKEIELPELKYAVFCGEPLYKDLCTEWQKCMPSGSIINIYGPTECTVVCTSYFFDPEIDKSVNGIVCIGKEMEYSELEILKTNGEFAKADEKGEICITGPQLINGYYNNPEKNKESFFTKNLKTYYHTGDIGFFNKSREFYFLGRKDHQIKVHGGFRVELSEIEHYARLYLKTTNVVAVGKKQESGIYEIIVAIEGKDFDKNKIHNYLANYLPAYMMPAKYIFLDKFPVNINGKIDRKKITGWLNYDG